MIVTLGAVSFLVVLVAVLAGSWPRAEKVGRNRPTDSAFLENFALHGYRPMLRLAEQTDRRFLKASVGEPLAATYRKIQRQLMREYLREAAKDFSRLYSIANAHSAEAISDPGDLSMAVLEQQMTFILLIWSIETRLLLDGILPFDMDLKPVITSIETLAEKTRQRVRPQFGYHAV
jgi:hypothetical protein